MPADRDLQHAPTRTAPAEPALDEALERQARVGRYVLLGRIGAGGMGVVYAAYDPDLDRRIAIKLVRARHHGEARLLREAKAMARLHHPNVITVHDVGVHEGQVFIAMDIVEGTTLRGLRVDRLPWTEVLAAYRKAGDGLAAAHRAGIVHRDFKPDNVLVAGDGRIVVTDFGLARFDEAEDDAPPSPDDADVDTRLTKTGSLVGTPVYMAPEQHRGAAADARSDQFAFCVSLYEALYGEHPFVDRTDDEPSVAAIADAVLAGRVRAEPARTAVPTWARAAILRGLSVDAAARWPSMEALLAALGGDPARRTRRIALAAIGLLALTGVLVVAFSRDRGGAAPPPCQGFETRLVGVWDDATKEAARAAFRATGQLYSDRTWDIVVRELDGYATRWVARAHDVCEATAVRHEQTETTHDLRSRCLDHRLRALRALGVSLRHADAAVVERAATAVRSLPDLEICDEPALLAAFAAPPDSRRNPAIAAIVEDRLAAARAARSVGHYEEAIVAANQAVIAGELLRDRGLAAGAKTVAALAARDAGHADAPERLEAAALAADTAGNDEDRMEALIGLLDWHVDGRRYDDARKPVTRARAVLARLGGTRPRLQYSLVSSEAQLAWTTNDYATSLKLRREQVRLAEGIVPRDENAIATSHLLLGGNLAQMPDGDRDEAMRELAAGREALTAALGPDHPRVATALVIEGAARFVQEDYAGSAELFRKASAIQRRTIGRLHPSRYFALYNLGRAALDLGEDDEALAAAEECLEVVRARPDGGGVLVARVLSLIAAIHIDAGRPEKALAPAQDALAVAEANHGTTDEVGAPRYNLARALWLTGRDRPRARRLVDQVIRAYAAGGIATQRFVEEMTKWRDEHMK